MIAVWFRFRAELRTRWRAWLVLALLVGVAGGIALAGLAGARRTDSAYPRFLESQRAYDMLIVSGRPPLFDFARLDLDEIAQLPQVTESARASVVPYFPPDGSSQLSADSTVSLVTTDGRYGTKMNRLFMLEGRAPKRPHEIAVSFLAAERFDVEVGDEFPADFVTAEQFEAYLATGGGGSLEGVPRGRLRVVGIEASPSEFPPLEATATDPFVHFAPSFHDSELFANVVELIAVRLQPGTHEQFRTELERRAGGRPLFYRDQVQATEATQRSMGVQADALRIVALLAAIVGLLVVGQLLVRQSRLDEGDLGALRALGMSSTQALGMAILRAAAVALFGAAVAVLVALALSPLTPVGLARKAETQPGIAFDALVLGVGAAAVAVGAMVAAAPGLFRVLRTVRAGAAADEMLGLRRPTRLTAGLAQAGLPPTVVTGVRLAVEPGRGPTASPVRSTIFGVGLAIAAIAAVTGFSASLDHLLDTPSLYGWNWDAAIGDPFSPDFGQKAARELSRERAVAAVAAGALLQVRIGDARVDVLALDSEKGDLSALITEGRRPRTDREVALGSKSLDDLRARIGERVVVHYGGRSAELRIVGQVVLPDLASSGGLGRGGAMTFGAARALAPNAAANTVLVRSASTGQREALVRRVRREFGEFPGVTTPRPPADLEDVRSVDSMPFVIGGLMVLVAIATIVHGLVTSVRRRRRDLALLKTLGMGRRQILAVVLWQATTVSCIALLIGIPLGILTGNLVWTAFSEQLGTLSETVVAGTTLALFVPVVVLVSNAVAAIPGWIAARTPVAVTLRSE